jgi:hypothetical protein
LHRNNWHKQGYTVPVLIARTRLLERAIYDVIHENLLAMNLSCLMLDLKRLNESLSLQLEQTVRSYQDSQQTTRPSSESGTVPSASGSNR